MTRTLGLFARQPVAGQVKTRLARSTSPEWAAQVAWAFLLDSLHRFQGVADRSVLLFTPDDDSALFRVARRCNFDRRPQGPGDLGERLARFIGCHVDEGPVVVIGSDSPTLPRSLIEVAFVELRTADVVIGPATDGGYYLIGCRRHLPGLFVGIDWGGRHVLAQTVEQLHGLDARLALLAPWYDVDTLDDWHTLVGHVAAMRRAGLDPGVPRTEAIIKEGLP
jgi:rSAM/selenodomain-associated transferase 1